MCLETPFLACSLLLKGRQGGGGGGALPVCGRLCTCMTPPCHLIVLLHTLLEGWTFQLSSLLLGASWPCSCPRPLHVARSAGSRTQGRRTPHAPPSDTTSTACASLASKAQGPKQSCALGVCCWEGCIDRPLHGPPVDMLWSRVLFFLRGACVCSLPVLHPSQLSMQHSRASWAFV